MINRKICLLLVVIFVFSMLITPAFAIKDDQIQSQNIQEADGTSGQDTNTGSGVKTGHIQDDAVTTSKISDGAVTDAKITGPISRSKIEGYANVAVVAKSGGDYTSPLTAMDDLSAWCGTPSANNPCLLKIMPGVYTIDRTHNMISYVDIEGSGENVTKIIASDIQSDNTAYCGGGGVISGSNDTEIRSLTIERIGHDQGYPNIALWTCGRYSSDDHNQKITNITAIAYGGTYNYAIFNNHSSPLMTNVKAKAIGNENDVANLTSNTVMKDVILMSGTMFNRDEYGSGIVVKCLGVYDGNYDPVSCP